MACQRTVGDIQVRGQFIHAHTVIFQENVKNFDTDIRAERFENIQAII